MDKKTGLDEVLRERYCLASRRIQEICGEETVPAPFCDFFRRTAGFLVQMIELKEALETGETKGYTLEQWQEQNRALYEDILPGQYDRSFGNPDYAEEVLGEEYGKLLGFLYTELRSLIVYIFEGCLEETLVHLELFIEVYNSFEQEELPKPREIRDILYWFASDYSELFVTRRIRESVDPSLDFALKIVMESDLEDLRYLYRYGEYVSENELETARFLNGLSEEEVVAIARTYTEGYRVGFAVDGKDISLKRTVNIRYNLGFERMVRQAVKNFRAMGLEPVIYRAAACVLNKRQSARVGYTGAVPNKQFEYDHRADQALFLDRKFMERKLGVTRKAYEQYKDLARVHGGPAVIEVFGEEQFVPAPKDTAYKLSQKQQQILVELNQETGKLTNHYIPGDERSFTIIAFPIPEIGENFPEIFRETVKINTLDSAHYRKIQQHLIDALDKGKYVHVKGKGENRTDLKIALAELTAPSRQTLFENCVADVNIPVGEVFTSPKLSGTEGILHVTQVYLSGLLYKDLEIHLKDGMVTEYSCGNFESREANLEYIRENLLFQHDTLPLGEFAVGTNTAAYAMARKYGIAAKLPILIAEKMGPHFALGDTCFSWQEDVPVFNIENGKEIIARDNEISLLRREDFSKAYFNCHTDITIPYEELDFIRVAAKNGEELSLIEDGRFVLPGTEELNEPLTMEESLSRIKN